jgi:C4-dicarboxylate-specific signal transduction histidine kinase
MLVTGAALLLTCGALLTYEQVLSRESTRQSVATTADMIAYACSGPLSLGEGYESFAQESLSVLEADPRIVAAVVYNDQGNAFAVYRRAGREGQPDAPRMASEGSRFGIDSFEVWKRVECDGERVGMVYLQAHPGEMWIRLRRYAIIVAGVLLAAAGVAFLLSIRLHRVISGPIAHLAEVASSVAAGKDFSVRARRQDDDELGRLIDCFNEMLSQIQVRDIALNAAQGELERRVQDRTRELEQEITERREAETALRERTAELEAIITEHKHAEQELERTHRQLLDTSRQAGMAEVATGVLHNVGNVLNSVNVSSTLLAERLGKSRVANLSKAVGLLQAHRGDMAAFLTSDPKGSRLPDYLSRLSEHLTAEHSAMFQEIHLLRKNIEHIKEIVAMQQSYARVSGLIETVDITGLVEDSLRMNSAAIERHKIELVREFLPVPPVTVDKHKVIQILVNLIRNAKYACHEAERPDKRITIRLTHQEERVRVSVIDNGVGIPPENLTRIFAHGFTTRKNGHGFGLHSGAIAARDLGGSLTVKSNGAGKGAVFTLELPCKANPCAA